MSWYPSAVRMELPESTTQPAIRPTQVILHSIVAPWTNEQLYEYWRHGSVLESHFGIQYDGAVAQFMNTQRRADANFMANMRTDGTGAISVETASDSTSSDPWTSAQVVSIVRLCQWAHRVHGVPLRVPTNHAEPGIGYHRLFTQWSMGGTRCPGDKRASQFLTVVLPMIKGDLVDFTDEQLGKIAYHLIVKADVINNEGSDKDVNKNVTLETALVRLARDVRDINDKLTNVLEVLANK